MTFQLKKNHQRYSSYRATGIPWLGEVPSEWEVMKFSRVYSSAMGNTLLKDDLIEGGKYPVFSATQENKYFGYVDSANVILNKDDLVIPARGNSIGFVKIVREPATTTQTTIYSRQIAKKKTNSKFIYYLLLGGKSELFYFDQTAIPQITVSQVNSNYIPLPPKLEQTAIANYLDEKTTLLDQTIEAKKKQINLLKERRSSLINRAVTKGIEDGVEMKESGVEWIGEVPKGWEVCKLKYITSRIVDGTHFTPTYTDSGIPFLRVTDVQSENIDLGNVKFVSELEHKQLSTRCNPQKNDILLSKNGTIGITKVVNWDWEFSVFVSLCLIKLSKNKIKPYYANYFFKSIALEKQMTQGGQTTSVTNLHLEKIKDFWFSVPPTKEQQKIVAYLDTETQKIDEIIGLVEKSIALLEEYKTSLISSVVTGKVRVTE